MAPPRPISVTLTLSDGKPVSVARDPTKTWAIWASEIDALEPELIEAIDSTGRIIRSVKWSVFDDAEDGELATDTDDEQVATATAPRLTNAQDGQETARFRIFATELSAAYRHATDVAFERLVSICDLSNRRLETVERCLVATERALRVSYQEQLEEALEDAKKAQGGDTQLGQLVGAFLGGKAQGEATSPGNGKQ
jgi:hypothetical protein